MAWYVNAIYIGNENYQITINYSLLGRIMRKEGRKRSFVNTKGSDEPGDQGRKNMFLGLLQNINEV